MKTKSFLLLCWEKSSEYQDFLTDSKDGFDKEKIFDYYIYSFIREHMKVFGLNSNLITEEEFNKINTFSEIYHKLNDVEIIQKLLNHYYENSESIDYFRKYCIWNTMPDVMDYLCKKKMKNLFEMRSFYMFLLQNYIDDSKGSVGVTNEKELKKYFGDFGDTTLINSEEFKINICDFLI